MTVRQQEFIWETSENFKIGDFKKSIEGEKVFVAEKDDSVMKGKGGSKYQLMKKPYHLIMYIVTT